MHQQIHAANGGNDSFIIYSDTFNEVLGENPLLTKLVETDAHEGPVYRQRDDALYFTSLPITTDTPHAGARQVSIKRVPLLEGDNALQPTAVSTIRQDSNMANGMALDRDGWLVICEQGTHTEHARISRLKPETGEIETVVDAWRGLRFNSPNDVVVKSDGTIWFTDPSYGYLQGFRPAPMLGSYVYRHDPTTNTTSVVADSFIKPNGLAFAPDESVLYINDSGANTFPDTYVSGPHHIMAFDVVNGRHLAHPRLFAVIAPGFPDGIVCDAAGNVYSAALSGVQVFNPSGDLIGEICVPGVVNFTFGGRTNNRLFMTNDTAIWVATLQASGATRPIT